MKTLHIVVSGRVQAVFFRVNTKKKAEELGITGTVTNLPSGDVEIFAQGKRLMEFVSWCSEGPAFARVNNIEVDEFEHGPYTEFRILR
jgi:acylphosphatase